MEGCSVEGSSSVSRAQGRGVFDGAPQHPNLEDVHHAQNCGNVPSVGSSPAHLSGAATPNKEQNRIIGFIGPPDLNNNFPQGPGAGAINLSLFKPVGAHEPESLSLSLSPQQRARNAALKQHQHQHQQKMFGGGPNMRPNGLEPGGGLTNPGPGPFGRGPSPFEGHLGRGPSPPNPPNGLQRETMTPPPSLDDMTERMSNMHMSPSQLQQQQQQQQMNSKALSGNVPAMMAAQMLQHGQLPPQLLQQLSPNMMSNRELMIQAQQQLGQQQQLQQQLQMQNQKVNWSPGSQPDMPPKGYKTVICKFWENNMCAKGSTCTFAHGADELQRFTGSSMATGLTSPSPLKLDRYKTKLCLFHMQSRCSKGTHCPYAHGMQELRQGPPGPTSLSPLGADMSPAAFFPQQPQQLSQQSLPPQQQLSPQQQQQLMAQMDQQMLINLNVHSQQASSAMYAPNWGGNDEQQLQMQAMMGHGKMQQMQQLNAGNAMPTGNMSMGGKEDEEPSFFTSVDQEAGALAQDNVHSLEDFRNMGENDGDLDAAQRMAAMRYFHAQQQQQQQQQQKFAATQHQDTDYKWQHMPNQMMMALVQDYPYGEMQTSRGGGTHGPPYSLPHEQATQFPGAEGLSSPLLQTLSKSPRAMPAPDAAQYMLQQAQQPAISQHAIYPISHAGATPQLAAVNPYATITTPSPPHAQHVPSPPRHAQPPSPPKAVSPSRRDAELRNMRHGMQENGAPVVGIGLSVQFDSGPGSKFVVSSITPGEAAARDGSIECGDRIVAVDGNRTTNWSGDTLQQAILGKAGSECRVTFSRTLSREVDKEWDVVLMRGGVAQWAVIDELDFMKEEIPRWNEVLRRETEARRACEVQIAQLREAVHQKNKHIMELQRQREEDAALIQTLYKELESKGRPLINQVSAQSKLNGMARGQPSMLAANYGTNGLAAEATDHVELLQGPRSGEKLRCVAATFGASRSVMAGVERGTPRLLPEGGYTFENLTRLNATIVLIADGQVDAIKKAAAALEAGAMAVLLEVPSGLPPADIGLDESGSCPQLPIPVVFCDPNNCQNLPGTLARVQIGSPRTPPL
eukprot:Tamp_03380.p1 GENE.Tamp_03380~~Tamp_03380.p1  ORF type:complete len:1075 (+),score=262.02 Tamp_03380:165-3389(+)